MSVTLTISAAIYNTLVSLADIYEPPEDEFNSYDSSGGNFDDAYAMGENSGREELAFDVIESHNLHKV